MNKSNQVLSPALVSSRAVLIAALVVLFASTAAFASSPQGTFREDASGKRPG